MAKQVASPAATGPGGEHFEAKVGAFYLLAMLLDAEPRGLPGAHIERIQLQGAGDGFPLDDVIVHAITSGGAAAELEIQAKRKIAFSPTDDVFRGAVEQIAEVLRAGRLSDSDPHAVAIATAQSSRQIDGPYQEVLLWARHSESPDAFFRSLNRPGASNEHMRTFVTTLRAHLAHFRASSDDAAVWTVLRRLQILVFDFSAEQGQTESLVRDRCAQALEPSEREKAGSLWSALTDIAQEVAEAGGDISASRLRVILTDTHGLRLAGLRQTRAARAALSEASQNALQDIRDHVGAASLSRRTRLDAINAALDAGRYVEILGDAGLGKSGVLRALAEQIAMGSNIIVLSPTRTIPRGWVAMRQAIGFEGSAKDLLSEIAASGGATLFLDSVDFFGDAERATASDLVRAGAGVPGFNVVVTARRSFGSEEPNWLPSDAIDVLGRSTVLIDELTDAELVELRSAAPELVPLLATGHPAREVVRNLFRLDRLVRQPGGDPVPHTEAEMAKLWWKTGDGPSGDQARDRTRILREFAESSFSGESSPFDTTAFAVTPLGQLLRSGTLRDLGGERMIFRHDVFRDWAVANLLREDGTKVEALPLAQLAPASLTRGIELAARFAIEGSPDDEPWKALLDRLSRPEVHSSWRRAVVIALVRSELSIEVLGRAKQQLLKDSGLLLRELVRTLMALEVAPAGRLLAGTVSPLPDEIAGLSIPTGPTWRRLVVWIFGLEDHLPANIIPDVAELYTNYAAATWLFDPLARDLTAQIHAWLMEMERDEVDEAPGRTRLFGGGLDYDKRRSLHDYLRSSFIALSPLQPVLAGQYLCFLLDNRRRSHGSAEQVVKTPGSLAQAAPKALAELTAAVLINEEKPDRRGFGNFGRQEAFTYADHEFMLPSPARGPFLDLLIHSPRDGLALIRRIVLHACTYGRDTSQQDSNAVVVKLDSGPRRFPYPGSYYWSRDAQGQYGVTSALMALEAWGHHRIDSGESVEAVIGDVLGDEEVPAAYLLVVVDLVLSHWPKSRKAGIPFVGTPELLSWDRSRQVHERIGLDLGGVGEKEPRALASRESLRKRASRQHLLEHVLPIYLFHDPQADCDALRARLKQSVARLGPYDSESSFADPRFMAVYALNQLDRGNYRQRQIRNEDGNEQTYFEYVSPETETHHLAPMQETANAQMAGINLRAQVAMALESPEKSSADLIARSIAFAREIDASGEVQPDFDNSVLMSAALVMRDGDASLRQEHGAWAQGLFRPAIGRAEDPVHRHRSGLRFNPAGIAAVGMTAVVRHGGGLAAARPLLELAVRGDPAFAHGLGADVGALIAIDPRLPTSLLRCAFAGNIRPHLRRYDAAAAGEDEVRLREFERFQGDAVDAEWRWLRGERDEPEWPTFPEARVAVRERRFIGGAPREARKKSASPKRFYVDHQAAAIWLSMFMGNGLVAPKWLRPIAAHYRDWTSKLNGADLDRSDELSNRPTEWNIMYFRLVARSLSGLDAEAIDELCLSPVLCLPDEPFLDVMSDLLLPLDVVYFDAKGVGERDAVRIRTALARRMEETSNWKNHVHRPGYGVEVHLSLALANLFLSSSGFREPPRCYVTALDMPRAAPFIPLLTEVAERGPSLLVVLLAMSIVTVSSDYPFLTFGVGTVHTCTKRFPNDTTFWIDYGVGKKFCSWIDGVLKVTGRQSLDAAGVRAQVEEIVSSLIRLGIAEATNLETGLQRT